MISDYMKQHELSNNMKQEKKIIAVYDYTDLDGKVLHQTVRFEGKKFSQRQPDGNGGWIWTLKKVKPVLYNLAEVVNADTIILCEGEKDCDNVKKHFGLTPTTNPMGAEKWRKHYNKYLKTKRVLIVPDDDDDVNSPSYMKGMGHAIDVANHLLGIAKIIKIIELPKKLNGHKIKDISDFIEAGGTKEEFLQLIETTSEVDHIIGIDKFECKEVAEGTEGTVSDKEIIPECVFPFEIFPEKLRNLISNFGTALHVNPELVASSLLPIMGGAIGNTVKISPKNKWEEPPFIWLNIIGETGYGKTPVINTMMSSVNIMQGKAHEKYKEEYKEYEKKMEVYKLKIKKSEITKGTETPQKPQLKHFIVSDFTIEALVDVFDSTPRGVTVYKDELSGLILGLNQYKGNKGNDRELILELFNAKAWKNDRKSIVNKYVPNTGVSIIGGMPPSVMPKVFAKESFDDGFLPRFLPLHSGYKPLKFSREVIKKDDLDYLEDLLKKCHEIPLNIDENGFVAPMLLELNGEALASFETFYNEYMGISPFVSSKIKVFIPKLITYCLRFTLILHVLECLSEKKEIDRKVNAGTINSAIKLTRFFAGQVMKAIELYGGVKEEFNEYQKRLIRTLYNLKDEVKHAKLPLSQIVELFNKDLHEKLKHTPEGIKSLLKELNIDTKKGTGHYSELIWETGKINNLFTKITVLTSPTVTPPTESGIPESPVLES